MGNYPEILESTLIDEVEKFFRNRFSDKFKHSPDITFETAGCYSSKIAIKSDKAQGFLSVNASPKTLKECHPERRYGDEITKEDLTDWVGEIANRILGNMKNDLLAMGVETTLNPPVCAHEPYMGEDESVGPLAKFYFSTDKEHICIMLQATFADDVKFEKKSA
ncbi:MAG: chemotaxis protein CheX [Pseudobacteriovorax sp.]|nr:chemotaxis protein CheX [Pseudobacteriovorax sp.]